MAMSRLLAMSLGKKKPTDAKVISEYGKKASKPNEKARNGATNRRKGRKQGGR